MKGFVAALAGLLVPAAFASAATLSLTVDQNNVIPGQQVIVSVIAVGGEGVNGADLLLFSGDGGPSFGGTTNVATAPKITGADLVTGTIFASNNTGTTYLNLDLGSGPEPLAGLANTTTSTGTVPANGLVGRFFVTAGTETGSFTLKLDEGNTLIGGVPASSLGSVVLTVIPEPASALLLIGALPFLRRRSA